ncbi:hypothetical protein Y032_0077g1085 [Ancylostoma ceylanicum]|uniref:PH domain-containing protein n=1 Tax=Ancylostoma ceylanicum TaxID=53326 RepID=A0A016TTW4_9BILA|nr:hypothetical protein Y032_0077g1085 [Ancylostoma ceylanicum]
MLMYSGDPFSRSHPNLVLVLALAPPRNRVATSSRCGSVVMGSSTILLLILLTPVICIPFIDQRPSRQLRHFTGLSVFAVQMEGPLSKWTNMVHGWQYRWFRLEEDALLYYTSREKMLKGQQRGCMRLHGAVVGIDGENNSLFTVTVDGKVFHLQHIHSGCETHPQENVRGAAE